MLIYRRNSLPKIVYIYVQVQFSYLLSFPDITHYMMPRIIYGILRKPEVLMLSLSCF